MLAHELADDGRNDDDYWLTFDLTAYQAPCILRAAESLLAGFALNRADDVSAYTRLLSRYVESLAQLAGKVATQSARGIFLPAEAIAPTRAIWARKRETTVASLRVDAGRLSQLDAPSRRSAADRINAIIETSVLPAYDGIVGQLTTEYRSRAPDTIGLMHYPHGRAVYDRLIRQHTGLALSAEEIHELGLRQVAELDAAMSALHEEMGVAGDKAAFHAALKADPRYRAERPEAVAAVYRYHVDRVAPRLGAHFRLLPKAPYGIRRASPEEEAGMTFGYYSPPSPAQPAGYYLFNGSDRDQRSMVGAAALIVHELLPGHHFHLALQQQNALLPDFRRHYMPTAYVEGWAEYAAHLGHELGVYDDPKDRYGRYLSESFLASRRVVDTGMNAMGWTLDEARAYLLENPSMSEVEVATETLRYAASIPGQALAYRIGSRKMIEPRELAERQLGGRFDPRDFHEVLLELGSLPLPVLAAKVDEYIARERAAANGAPR